MKDGCIGVMDSGMGGLSVLRSLVRELPRERFVYWGDNKNAPYGTRVEAEIYALTRAIVDRLLASGAKAIVIACNTATSAAASRLRNELTLPIFGIEPALKPASLSAEGGRVIVLATEATIRFEKYRRLLGMYGDNTLSLPCPELVEFVENGVTEGAELDEYLNALFRPFKSGVSAVVLGCTHFSWLKRAVERCMPGVQVFDGNEGIARHVRDVLAGKGLLSEYESGGVEVHTTSDDPSVLDVMKRLYNMEI